VTPHPPHLLRPLALAACLAASLAAEAQPSLVDQIFERHVRVKAAVGGGVLHMLYQRKADPQAPPASCYRRYVPGRGWLGEERFSGAHRCVAFFDDALYVFRDDNYSIYRARDWRAPHLFDSAAAEPTQRAEWRSHAWPLDWPPAAACPMGQQLWVFGIERKADRTRIRAARLPAPSGQGPPPAPTLLGKPLATPAPASDLALVPRSGAAMVFWHQDAPGGEGNEVWRATFDGAAWDTPASVPVPYANSDYAVAEHDGVVWLACKPRGQRIRADRPLVVLRLAGGRWTTPAAVPGAADPWLNWTLDIDAASFGGQLFVLRACMDSLVVHRWQDGRWLEPQAVLRLSPLPTYLFWWLLGNVAASLVLLPVVAWAAFRMRRKPRPRVPLAGVPVPVATWPRRVAAQLVDILVVLLLSSAALRWLGVAEATVNARGDALAATLAVCSALFFVYFVVSEAATGQSFGKLLLRIAVVRRDGRRPGLGRSVARNLLRPWPFFVPAACLVGSLCVLLTRSSRRLGDMLAGTLVVDLPPLQPAARPDQGAGRP